ncbi:MAG: hypothetical protein IJY08_01250 [Clostridia bacterium]|nr:hypothetical protein [Clostridia bacterium]
MFGYVKVNSAELKVKEYEMYRGAYCGLCRSMGKCTGQCSRMTLSYDFAFLAALRLCLENTEISFSQRRCFVHPLKKRSVMDANPVLDYCAHSAAILNYHKIKDDLADERGLKRLRARLVYPFVAHARKKALTAGLGELDGAVSGLLALLADTEAQGLSSVDTPAAIFGDILSEIVSFGLDGSRRLIAVEIGRAVGRWIYTVDALDDMSEDEKKGRYNPILLLYDGRRPKDGELSLISDALKAALVSAESAMDLMDTDRAAFRNIVENILFLGMPDTAERIIGRERDKSET